MTYARRVFLGSTGLALLAACGCGDGAPSVDTTTQEAKVSGKVTFKGKPVTEGRVTFDPANAQRKVGSRTAEITKDGTYTVTTLVGRNGVSVLGKQIAADPKIGYQNTTYDVKSGDNTFDLVLPIK